VKRYGYLLLGVLLIFSCSGLQQNQILQGRKIVVTAPAVYASRLQKALEKYGASVILMPMIETLVYDSLSGFSQLLHDIKPGVSVSDAFDFIVLPSRNAIKAYDNEMHLHFLGKIPYKANYYVLGSDKKYLEQLGYSTPIVIPEPSMMGILAYIKSNAIYKGKKMLLVAPKVSMINEPNVVPQFMREALKMGIECNRIDGYTTRPVNDACTQMTLSGLREGKYDMVAFSSGGELFAMAEMGSPDDLNCAVACFGPYTASNAKKVGIKVDMVSQNFRSFDDYAQSIVAFFMH